MLQETKARNAARRSCSREFSRVSAAGGRARSARPPGSGPRRGRAPSAVHRTAEALFQRHPQGQDHGAADQLPRRRSARSCSSTGLQQAGRGRLLHRGHAAARGLPRQPVPDRGRAGLRRRRCRPTDLVDLCRFANRVPLLYQQSACAITRGGPDRPTGGATALQQSAGALPAGPMVHRRAHRLGLGAVHLRDQGGDRRLPGDRQGDPARPCRSAAGGWRGYVRRGRRRAARRRRSGPTSRSTSRTSASRCRRSSALDEAGRAEGASRC